MTHILQKAFFKHALVKIWRKVKMSYSFVFFSTVLFWELGLQWMRFLSLANGLHEPKMRVRKMCGIAGIFGGFQAFMPMAGWLCPYHCGILPVF